MMNNESMNRIKFKHFRWLVFIFVVVVNHSKLFDCSEELFFGRNQNKSYLCDSNLNERIMKIKSMYKVRQVAGENLIVGQGRLNADMTKVISLNDTAVLLWNELTGKDFTCEDAADVLVANYGIEKERAMADAAKWIEKMNECDILEA